jgi:sugar lactone lactonase YvrE
LTTACWLTAVLGSSVGWPDEHPDLPADDAVVPQLYATGFEFAEGPTLDGKGNLFVVNYRGNGNIGRITPDGTASVICLLDDLLPFEERLPRANGLKIDSEGRLIVADSGAGRLLRIDPDGGRGEVLTERCNGVRFNSINDVALDLAGNIFFTDPGGSSLDNPIGSVYRYDIGTKKTTPVVTGLAFPNGIAVTPDQEHLCVSDSQNRGVLIYDLAEDGTLGGARTLIKFGGDPEQAGGAAEFQPDGMIFDAKGRLYVATWVAGIIAVVEVPSGRLLRRYPAGGSRVTNCHFHGDYLYTTVASKEAVFRLKLDVRGFDYSGP